MINGGGSLFCLLVQLAPAGSAAAFSHKGVLAPRAGAAGNLREFPDHPDPLVITVMMEPLVYVGGAGFVDGRPRVQPAWVARCLLAW